MNNKICQYAIVSFAFIVSWLFVYLMNGTVVPTAHAFYLPIIISARFWGVRGGLIAGLVSGVLVGPLMPDDVDHEILEPAKYWIIRMLFFIIIGGFLGKLFTLLKDRESDILGHKNKIEEQLHEISSHEKRLFEFAMGAIDSLAKAIEARDLYTSGHCRRVADMSLRIGEHMHLAESELLRLKWAALLHDVGKIGVPESVLNNSGKLTADEYEIMKRHPEIGAKILEGIPNADFILDGILQHHERFDGKGYPRGLSGEQIGLQARIISVCDVWDALTSKRSYRDAISHTEALKIMESGRGSQFDSKILDAFLEFVHSVNQTEQLGET